MQLETVYVLILEQLSFRKKYLESTPVYRRANSSKTYHRNFVVQLESELVGKNSSFNFHYQLIIVILLSIVICVHGVLRKSLYLVAKNVLDESIVTLGVLVV